MSNRRFVIAAALLALALPASAAAQRVRADVRIGTGPVSGRVVITDGRHYAPRRIHVAPWRYESRYRRGRGGRVLVVVFYDPYRDRFYDSYRPGLRRVEVFRYRGRYYRSWDRGDWRRYDRDRFDHDRFDRDRFDRDRFDRDRARSRNDDRRRERADRDRRDGRRRRG